MRALESPIVLAPMAGGVSTPALVAAVAEAGGFGFLPAGYRSVAALAADIEALRTLSAKPFGVNVFTLPARPAEPVPQQRLAAYATALQVEADRHGVTVGEPRFDDDHYADKLELLLAERPAVVSFTFGCPDAATVAALQAAGAEVWVTVTDPREAATAQAAGADVLVAQGIEAGGHRGTFGDGPEQTDFGVLALLRLLARQSELPLVAAGGIVDGASVAAVLCAGAVAAQLGTAFMLTPEAATNQAQRQQLGSERPTRLTRAFTGRQARGIVNRFMEEHEEQAFSSYPQLHHMTSPIRAAARTQGDAEAINLWAGQAHSLAPAMPAADLVRMLIEQTRTALASVHV